MINNAMVRKGQTIPAAEGKIIFTVEDIRPDAVTISAPVTGAEPVTFELKMKH
jgi:hypothetical protein